MGASPKSYVRLVDRSYVDFTPAFELVDSPPPPWFVDFPRGSMEDFFYHDFLHFRKEISRTLNKFRSQENIVNQLILDKGKYDLETSEAHTSFIGIVYVTGDK